MKFPKRLLVCVEDASGIEVSQAVLGWLGDRLECPVVVYHDAGPWAGQGGEDAGEARAELEAAVAGASGLRGADVRIVVETEVRDLASGILETAAHQDADLVVLPVHRRKGLPRVLARDAAEQLVHSCRIPVLTLDRERLASAEERPAFDLVVAPLDYSPPSIGALARAGALAARFGTPLLVVHAIPDLVFTLDPRVRDVEGWAREAATKRLQEAVASVVPEGVTARAVAEVGRVADVLSDAIAGADNPLVVMATAGHDSTGDRVLGSRTERIFRSAGAAVLVLPPAFVSQPVPVGRG